MKNQNVGKLLFKVKCQCSSEKFIICGLYCIKLKLVLVAKWEEQRFKDKKPSKRKLLTWTKEGGVTEYTFKQEENKKTFFLVKFNLSIRNVLLNNSIISILQMLPKNKFFFCFYTETFFHIIISIFF